MSLLTLDSNNRYCLDVASLPLLERKRIDDEMRHDPEWETDFSNRSIYFTVNGKAAKRYARFADSDARNLLNRTLIKKYDDARFSLPLFFDVHQVAGVRHALSRSRSYLAHAPGAGKTLQTLAIYSFASGAGQCLLIVPPSLTANWAREIDKWDLALGLELPTVSIIGRTEKQDDVEWGADFIICPDSMLAKAWVLKKLAKLKFKVVAVDEASRFNNHESKRTVALFGGKVGKDLYSPGLIQEARHAVLLDGSPMPNRAIELWAPTYAMAPEAIDFRDYTSFGLRYGGAKQNDHNGGWEFKGSSREEELHAKLTKDFMHVVTEEKLNHPERLRSMLFMNEDVRTHEQKKWERANLSKINFSEFMGRDGPMEQGELARFRRQLGERKAAWVANYVKERLESKDESILVFAWHRNVVLKLGELLNAAVIMGGTDVNDREKILHEFQNEKRRVVVLNIASGGRGFNLQRADRIVFAEWSWNDEQNKQCEKRASRRGRSSTKPVRSDYIVASGSLDEPVINTLFTKEKRVRRIIG